MSKAKIHFVCQECGADSPKWLGRCPGCESWNSMVEETLSRQDGKKRHSTSNGAKPRPITEVDNFAVPRLTTGVGEFDRVLGGGIVPGALILIGGDPGIGKSTMLLQVACSVSRTYGSVLYVSGEESAAQTKMRAERLNKLSDKLLIMTETNLDEIALSANQLKPALMIIDSIQTMYSPEIPSAPGSVGQVRESTGKLLRLAKETGIPIAIIGHVTKEGNIAGPRILEHMVDVVLYFEGEKTYAFRVLRAIKNRFGSTHESGIFSMEEDGLMEVKNPSGLLLSERPESAPGSVVLACMEGVRPLLIEIQALVSTTCFGMPRRMAVGFDYNRLILLMAVLEKRVGLMLGNQDAYVNAVGGIKVTEPAADLAVILAVASSFRSISLDAHTVVMGEVGLTGEVRMVSRVDVRISEAATMGFKRFVIPAGNLTGLKIRQQGLKIVGVSNVIEAMEAVFL
ncbi:MULTISPECIES: DNA repair protein RadA [Pelosinus]|uniref:DNA repair protein RadA n=1 Tax=Pelosinus fermentans B4 TaxID=1149862 RepID=I9L6R6_9FIRM|nr:MULTISPECIES: DNA repair protein RadA [Pelosinus]EIW16064.1 DNA repair protein RadA [Pelosinus fermentans B4]EIW25972.1 DNA repair protein RadA [Pelosinus fermentans A11]OAM95895.1 DNA repair protein RadA [Pelosinus fermentans DSM 17108]SDR34054.1 DNA repair protein RadA/Sms [Pelosinus fermentans]